MKTYTFMLSGSIIISGWSCEYELANDERAYDRACEMLHTFALLPGFRAIRIFDHAGNYIGEVKPIIQHEVTRPLKIVRGGINDN